MDLRAENLPRRSSNIFINYRREDSAGYAGRLFDRLSGRFPDRVFMDVDTIEPGIDFVDTIEQAVGCCEVLIVVIGSEWLHLTDASGRRRLENPNDFVRLEIATALDRNIRIIPVLVEGAAMPRPEDLPPDLAKLTRRNAIELSDVRWAFDVDRLIQAIEGVLQERAPSALLPIVKVPDTLPAPAVKEARPRPWLALAVLALLPALGWIGWSLASQRQADSQKTGEVISSPGPVAPAALPQTEVTLEKATPQRVTQEKAAARPPKDVTVSQREQREPGSKTSPGRLGTLVRKGKSVVKNLRDRAKRGGEEVDDQRDGGEKQQG